MSSSVGPPVTVLGQPLADEYEWALAHEHVFIDLRCWLDESDPETSHLRDLPIDESTFEEVRRNPFSCIDNVTINGDSDVVADLAKLAELGSVLVVDVTPANIGRNPAGLADVSRSVGVDIVYGCGRYVARSRPDDDASWAAERYRDEILAEFSGSGPRPAVIGEIGTSDPIHPVEISSLRGAAMAQRETGVPLYVHLEPWARRGHQALDIIEAGGGDLAQTVLCHLDPQIPGGLDYHRELMSRGARIAFDIWGDEYRYGAVSMPFDQERIDATLQLVSEGYGSQLVHSQDICTKIHLQRWGGPGYDHLPAVIAPRLRAAGLDEAQVRQQLGGNVLELLKGGAQPPKCH